MACLYRLTSVSGKQYIGIAKNFAKRMSVHCAEAKAGSDLALHKAIRKYGFDLFTKEILVVADYEYVKELEPKAIVAFNTRVPSGYNITAGGDGTVGYRHTAAAKEAVRWHTKERMKIAENRKHLSDINSGKKQSAETVAKKSESMKQLRSKVPSPLIGKTMSKDAREKISKSLLGNSRTKGRPLSNEHKIKLSLAMKGREFSAETRERLRIAQLGKKCSDEVRVKMSHAAKLREQRKKEIKYAANQNQPSA